MDGGAEDELPQPAKPKVRAISPDSNTATVTRFTIPPDTREFRISPDLVTGASSFTKGVTTSYSSTWSCPILELSPLANHPYYLCMVILHDLAEKARTMDSGMYCKANPPKKKAAPTRCKLAECDR